MRTICALADGFLAHPDTAKALPTFSDQDIAQTLAGVVGVGAWTLNVDLISGLGRPDFMPANDLGIRHGVQLLASLPEPATTRQVEARAAHWRPPSQLGVRLSLDRRETEASSQRPKAQEPT